MSVGFNFYLINFQLEFVGDNIYLVGIASGVAEIIGYTISYPLYKYAGLKITLMSLFATSTLGGVLIIVFDNSSSTWLLPALIVLAKFGITALFAIVYLANAHIFPTLFTGTSMGICNFVTRIAIIFAPYIAPYEVTSMSIFTIFAAISFFLSAFIKKLDIKV